MRVFGALTPAAVWDLTVEEFHVLAGQVDQIAAAARAAQPSKRR